MKFTGIIPFNYLGHNVLGKLNRWELKEEHLEPKDGRRIIYLHFESDKFKNSKNELTTIETNLFPLFLSDQEDVSKSGKKKYVDKHGNFSFYVNDVKELKDSQYLDTGSLRPAYKYEETFVQFFKAVNSEIDRETKNLMAALEKKGWTSKDMYNDPSKFGKMMEIKKQQVGLMLTVRKNLYEGRTYYQQEIFPFMFGYVDATGEVSESSKKYMTEQLAKNPKFTDFFSTDFEEFKVPWTKVSNETNNEPNVPETSNSGSTSNGSAEAKTPQEVAEEADFDDLPF